ncbi:hypothetical protein F383_01636 [Gossypium arboreum]|uniref:Uncharacterized protein n=1 Tax=Gossypium arboreum TaxID=29729 RepID=A0A0B0N148_GOSAR|nr:hypothetical protein F383_01636 [Gossypium arboreum]
MAIVSCYVIHRVRRIGAAEDSTVTTHHNCFILFIVLFMFGIKI